MSKRPKTSEPSPLGDDATIEHRDGHITPSPAELDATDEIEDAENTTEDDTDGNYSVGYRNPPRHSQFRPGETGNPRGRPKGAQGLKTLAREFLTGKVKMRTGDGVTTVRRIDALLQKNFEAALKGNARATSELLKLYNEAVPEDEEDQRDESATLLVDMAKKFLTGGYAAAREYQSLVEGDCDASENSEGECD